jgi:hypothetical protein
MTVSVNGTTGITFNDASTQNTAATGFGFKNRIINGAMQIDQRNAGASVTASAVAATTYTIDRFAYVVTQASKFTLQQNAGSVTPPVGFTNYLGITSSSAYSVTSTDTFLIAQNIEGLNVSDLGWGTANASTVTLSFWVRSSLTGTFGGAIVNGAGNRSYAFSYTISAANTWEQKSVTIAGDTSGTWLTTNGVGLRLRFGLGSGSTYTGTAGSWGSSDLVQPTGSVSVVGTSGATFYITGVQLEKGSTATSFDYRPYTTEFLLCQRYYTKYSAGAGFGRLLPFALGNSSSLVRASVQLPVRMRAAASSVDYGGDIRWYNGTAVGTVSSVTIDTANDTVIGLNCNTSGASSNQAYMINDSGANTAYIGINAEL